ncbi:unnamed protein product [Protopolystoma xenopodis]|uniref:HECT-type E3 ubiquitin transferase n=1 Tax=Protopolystoma xenopodis TaxID=117903 RepID=A0A3S5CDG3_9PLAT|nr:unnamed protein product [Protopolystoma xenopodis]
MPPSSFRLSFIKVLHLENSNDSYALVVGSEVTDWSELRRNTSYQGEYWDRHPIIEWFWDVFFNDCNLEDKKKFLRFLTGCDRVPIVGLKHLKTGY